MHENLMVVHKHNKPYGIRDSTGFLFFFTDITKYPGQESRYRQEVFEQYELADFLINALRGRAAENQGAVAEQRITGQSQNCQGPTSCELAETFCAICSPMNRRRGKEKRGVMYISKCLYFRCLCSSCGVELGGQFLGDELFVHTAHQCIPFDDAALEAKEGEQTSAEQRKGEIVKFRWNGNGYSCSNPGEMSGEYIRVSTSPVA